MLIDDFTRCDLVSALGTRWRGVSDRVMGGISTARVEPVIVDDAPGMRLTGDVRLENNGGFVQAALDLAPDGGSVDATGHAGVRLRVRGNGERYSVHLRTDDVTRPWQSYRAHFVAPPRWDTVRLPFEAFAPHRIDAPLDLRRLRRLGVVAIGRVFTADVVVGEVALYR